MDLNTVNFDHMSYDAMLMLSNRTGFSVLDLIALSQREDFVEEYCLRNSMQSSELVLSYRKIA